jgi:hypothetical protein
MQPYFGYSDAGDETNLKKYFVKSSLFNGLKKGNKETGIFVVPGIKGAGKTALCNMIQADYEGSSLVLKIDKTFGFDVRTLKSESGAVEGLMCSLLLKELLAEVLDSKDVFSSQAIKKIDSTVAKFKRFLSKIPSAIKVKAGPLELDPSKIQEEDVSRFSRFDIAEYVESLTPVLRERKAYILIDDVDDVFAGADRDAEFVEGLLRAAKEINKAFKDLMHCLVFLKTGVFKLFFENAGEYDKLRDYISPQISWGQSELTNLLAVRIRQIHQKPEIDDKAAWELEFEPAASIESIQKHIISRCVSGPRDLIVYCNMAKDRADGSKIKMSDIEQVEDLYSKEKLATLNRDFGSTYPRINDFLQQLFSGETQTYSNEGLINLLTTKVIAEERLRAMFKGEDYVLYATKERLIELLYGIGFLGFKRTAKAPLEFVITNPDPGSQVLYRAHEYQIHPAYRQYLNLKA